MRLLFIRHGDRSYTTDSLTEQGIREAKALAACAEELDLGDCYISPYGRAQETASYCLEATGKTAEAVEWLSRFAPELEVEGDEEMRLAFPDAILPDGSWGKHMVLDMMPEYFTRHPELWDPSLWRSSKVSQLADVPKAYDEIVCGFDGLLAKYGYLREGGLYHVEKESTRTLTFFCHFGVTCVILAHLWNVSPFALLHSIVTAPSSITELFTEERQQGKVYFRAGRIGDISHLTLASIKPSFASRFCEVYSNMEQRH